MNDADNIPFKLAADFINKSNHPVFLTGKAGTGKTTFLKYIKEQTIKNSAIVAPTGVAAMNAGGTTIHSFFQLPFTPFVPGKFNGTSGTLSNDAHQLLSHLRLNAERKELLQQLDLLIIDEISMVRADVLDAIDTVLRHVRQQMRTPFGGVQVLYIGDMYQLPPVIKQDEWKILSDSYNDPFFFSSKVVGEQPPVYIELDKVYRQKDEDFIKLLNQVRNNDMDESGYELLHSRYTSSAVNNMNGIITLTTHNAGADAINAKALAAINEKEWSFKAAVEGSFYENSFPADENLVLKEGAQVMFIKNDMEKNRRYFNGKIGMVHKMENDKIWVECTDNDSSQLIELKKETWRNIKYTLNKKTSRVEEEELGTFTQFPLRLAWAITIHKSQGLTFEKAVIDAGNAFAPGQVYVALSRCRSLDGLQLLSKISYESLRSDPRIVQFAKSRENSATQEQLLKEARRNYEEETLQALFDFSPIAKLIVSFKSWVNDPMHFKDSLNNWLALLDVQWKKIAVPGKTFVAQLIRLRQDGNVTLLDERIKAAATYFLKELKIFDGLLVSSPALTDNRQMATDYNKKLQEIYDAVYGKLHFLEPCLLGFSMEIHDKRKLNFTKKPLNQNAYSGKSVFVPRDIIHPRLYTALKNKRDELCNELDLPVYMVCNSASLEEMTNALPQTLHALGNVSGFGKIKLKQFGKAFIDIISDYCEENALDSNPGSLVLKKIRKPKNETKKPDTKLQTFDLFKFGKSITEIAEARKLTVSTIEGHMAHYVAEGKINLEDLLDGDKIRMIAKERQDSGTGTITQLKERLPTISYGELRLFLASEKYISMMQ